MTSRPAKYVEWVAVRDGLQLHKDSLRYLEMTPKRDHRAAIPFGLFRSEPEILKAKRKRLYEEDLERFKEQEEKQEEGAVEFFLPSGVDKDEPDHYVPFTEGELLRNRVPERRSVPAQSAHTIPEDDSYTAIGARASDEARYRSVDAMLYHFKVSPYQHLARKWEHDFHLPWYYNENR